MIVLEPQQWAGPWAGSALIESAKSKALGSVSPGVGVSGRTEGPQTNFTHLMDECTPRQGHSTDHSAVSSPPVSAVDCVKTPADTKIYEWMLPIKWRSIFLSPVHILPHTLNLLQITYNITLCMLCTWCGVLFGE